MSSVLDVGDDDDSGDNDGDDDVNDDDGDVDVSGDDGFGEHIDASAIYGEGGLDLIIILHFLQFGHTNRIDWKASEMTKFLFVTLWL